MIRTALRRLKDFAAWRVELRQAVYQYNTLSRGDRPCTTVHNLLRRRAQQDFEHGRGGCSSYGGFRHGRAFGAGRRCGW